MLGVRQRTFGMVTRVVSRSSIRESPVLRKALPATPPLLPTPMNLIRLLRLMERPLYFDPFGQTGFAPVGHNIIAPCKVLVQGSILFYPFRDSGFF